MNGDSLIYIQLNGAPVYSSDAQNAANNSGAVYLGNTVNDWDFVGNGLGANNGWVQFLGSAMLMHKLFGDDSPHSSYYCQGSLCNDNQSTTSD